MRGLYLCELSMPEKFEFSKEVIESRYLDHWYLAENFQEQTEENFSIQTTVDSRRLFASIYSAYEDIARYKNYHLTNPAKQKSDAVKRTAFLTKWICRFKPILVEGGSCSVEELREKTQIDCGLLVNELFALYVTTVNLSVQIGRDFALTEEKQYDIAYDLLFRHINEDSLLMAYQAILEHVSDFKTFHII